MAKRLSSALATITPTQLAEVVAPAATPPINVITIPPGGTLAVIVDVGPMTIPYTVSYAGRTVIKALVDRAAAVPLIAGDHVLAWAFGHIVKDWHHAIGVSINGANPILLESKSEANKDQDHIVNFVVVKS